MAKDWGYIHVITGSGKGKTTAALGTAIRAFGRGKKVVIIYFDKGGFDYGERRVLDQLGLEYHVSGLDRIDKKTGKFRFGVLPEDIAEAERGFAIVKRLSAGGQHDLMILDEINTTISLGMLKVENVMDWLDHKPENLEVILTGRHAPAELVAKADVVSDIQAVKHYFEKGVRARRGVEY